MATRSKERTEFLGDVIICIAEDYGYNSWRQVSAYDWSDEHPETNTATVHELADLEDEPDISVHKVTIETVATGISRIMAPDNHLGLNNAIRRAVFNATVDNDAGEIDAEVADCILQAGIFDEYRYG